MACEHVRGCMHALDVMLRGKFVLTVFGTFLETAGIVRSSLSLRKLSRNPPVMNMIAENWNN